MKKGFLILMVFAMALVGCSSDSGGGSLPATEANILGKWYLRGVKLNNEPFEPSEFDCPTSKDFNEIFSNHRIIFTGYGTDCMVNDTQDSEWTLVGNTFSVLFDPAGEPDVYQLIKLTDTEMQMKQTLGSDATIYYLNRL